MRYIEMHRGAHTFWVGPPHAECKGRRSRTRRRSQCVLVKIWRSTWNTHLVWRLNVVVRLTGGIYKTYVSTLHCALENGTDLYVNERQKIRHYRARSTEERRRKKKVNAKSLCFTSRVA